MGRRKGPLSFARKMVLPRRLTEMQPISPIPNPNNNSSGVGRSSHGHGNADGGNLGTPAVASGGGSAPKGVKKKAGGSRLWMRFDRTGQTELLECDKSAIIQRAGIPARDLRILGPVFSHSSNILGSCLGMEIDQLKIDTNMILGLL